MEKDNNGNGNDNGKKRHLRPVPSSSPPFIPAPLTKGKTQRRPVRPIDWERKLNPRELKYVEIILADPTIDRVEAVIQAGFPPAKAEQYANLLGKMRKIKLALADYNDALADEVILDRNRVLQEQCRIAFFDPRKLPGFPEDIDDATAAGISGFELTTTVTTGKNGSVIESTKKKFSFWNKNVALGDLMRNLGMYKADNDQGRPMVQINNIDLSDFSQRELETLAKVGLVANGSRDLLPACIETVTGDEDED